MKTQASLLRAARALLGESQRGVGEWVGLSPQEVSRWETAGYKLMSPSGVTLQKAFEKRGLEFLSVSDDLGPGVRWLRPVEEYLYRSTQFRAARAMAGLSMREIERRCGVSRSFQTRFEQGQVAFLNLDKERALEATFRDLGIILTPGTTQHGAGVRWAAEEAQL